MSRIELDESRRWLIVDGRRLPVSEAIIEDSAWPTQFAVRRAVVPLENRWSLSVIWGTGTYSDNHDHMFSDAPFTETPEVVEVGIIHPDGGLYCDPLAYIPAETLPALVTVTSGFPSDGVNREPEDQPYADMRKLRDVLERTARRS